MVCRRISIIVIIAVVVELWFINVRGNQAYDILQSVHMVVVIETMIG